MPATNKGSQPGTVNRRVSTGLLRPAWRTATNTATSAERAGSNQVPSSVKAWYIVGGTKSSRDAKYAIVPASTYIHPKALTAHMAIVRAVNHRAVLPSIHSGTTSSRKSTV